MAVNIDRITRGADVHVLMSVFIIVFGCCLHGVDSIRYCYNEEESPNRNYSTGTPYIYREPDRSQDNPRGCSPDHIWLLSREGTSFPERAKIGIMNEYLTKLQDDIMNINNMEEGSLCTEDIRQIRSWTPQLQPENALKLSEAGKKQLVDIGHRLSSKYPSLLGVKYEQWLFEFRHTDLGAQDTRTRDSAKAFAKGAFGYSDGVSLVVEYPDWLLEFYKHCDAYRDEVARQPITEFDTYKRATYTEDMIRELESRAGLRQGYFTHENILLLYDACRLEFGIYGDSPWCALLTPEALDILEYGQDLKSYWTDGYGKDISYRQACPLLSDLFASFDSVMENNQRTKKAVGRFAQVDTIASFLARLGLYQDYGPLRASDYYRNGNRKWRTSQNTPFAGNVAFVLYKCDHGYVVQVYVNEKIVQLPRCGLSCPYEMFRELYGSLASGCNMDKICQPGSGANDISPMLNAVVLVIIAILFHLL